MTDPYGGDSPRTPGEPGGAPGGSSDPTVPDGQGRPASPEPYPPPEPYPTRYGPPAYGPPAAPPGPAAAQPGGYGAGGYGVDTFGMPVPTRVDTLANVAMGVGIGAATLGVFGCCCAPLGIVALVGGIAGLVLGLVSRRNISAAGGRLAGRGQSLAGIVTGAVGIVLGLGWIVLTIVGVNAALTG